MTAVVELDQMMEFAGELREGMAVVNDRAALRRMKQAAGQVLGKEKVHVLHPPSLTGEDSGWYLDRSRALLDSSAAGIRIGGSCMRFTSPDSIWMKMSWCMGLEYGCA
ncbi:hypothetical protein AB4124_16135 [Paenibacillus sp. 2KB_20]|uniref:hypothetical protein n=1 Tax=Paenibacillus sp. 2KB_20 TaxID=3232977 RepID=UPI003F9E95DB